MALYILYDGEKLHSEKSNKRGMATGRIIIGWLKKTKGITIGSFPGVQKKKKSQTYRFYSNRKIYQFAYLSIILPQTTSNSSSFYDKDMFLNEYGPLSSSEIKIWDDKKTMMYQIIK